MYVAPSALEDWNSNRGRALTATAVLAKPKLDIT